MKIKEAIVKLYRRVVGATEAEVSTLESKLESKLQNSYAALSNRLLLLEAEMCAEIAQIKADAEKKEREFAAYESGLTTDLAVRFARHRDAIVHLSCTSAFLI
jgi:hypothetical protein